LWTSKYSFLECGTLKIFSFEVYVVPGEMPWLSAVASVNGLNEEPGWRCPFVARLNGWFS
jgi:hypothetical protein